MPAVKYRCFATKRAFGVELEANPDVPRENVKKLIRMVSDVDVAVTGWEQSVGNNFWHIKTDSTCGPKGHIQADYGTEIASYKASGHADIAHIAKVADFLNKSGVTVNDNCGLHIHAECGDFTPEQVAIMVAYWAKIEPFICCMVPDRRVQNKHCKLWYRSGKFSLREQYAPSDFWDMIRPTNFAASHNPQKRMTLNLINYAGWVAGKTNGNRRTVEIRIPEGTMVGDDIANWIKMFVHFVSTVKKKPMPEDEMAAKNLEEFFYILGLGGQDEFFILSTGLRKTKEWILNRMAKSAWSAARNKKIVMQATDMLNSMTPPDGEEEDLEETEEFVVEDNIVSPPPKTLMDEIQSLKKIRENLLKPSKYKRTGTSGYVYDDDFRYQ